MWISQKFIAFGLLNLLRFGGFDNRDETLGRRFLGDYMNPAVFVWYAEVEFFEGDVTLVRD